MTLRSVCMGLAIAASLIVLLSAQGDTSTDQLRQALAQRTMALGACNAELGPLQQLQAQVISGKVADVAATLAQIRTQFEQANPGKTFDDKFVVAAKPPLEK